MATISPKQALDLAKQNKAQFVDLKFNDFLGIWQHFTIPIDELSEADSASTAPPSAAGRRSTPPTCSSCRTPTRR
jgi:glutamine synthetase